MQSRFQLACAGLYALRNLGASIRQKSLSMWHAVVTDRMKACRAANSPDNWQPSGGNRRKHGMRHLRVFCRRVGVRSRLSVLPFASHSVGDVRWPLHQTGGKHESHPTILCSCPAPSFARRGSRRRRRHRSQHAGKGRRRHERRGSRDAKPNEVRRSRARHASDSFGDRSDRLPYRKRHGDPVGNLDLQELPGAPRICHVWRRRRWRSDGRRPLRRLRLTGWHRDAHTLDGRPAQSRPLAVRLVDGARTGLDPPASRIGVKEHERYGADWVDASRRALRQQGRLDRAYRRSGRHGHGPRTRQRYSCGVTRYLAASRPTRVGVQANTCWGGCIRAARCARVGPLATPKHVEDFVPRGFARGAFYQDFQVRDTTFDAAYQVVE